MKSKILAKRYAEAYMEYARPEMGREKAVDEIKGLKKVLKENPQLQVFLMNPGITCSEKCGVLENVGSRMFSGQLVNFLKLLVEKGRASLLSEINDEIVKKYLYEEEAVVLLKTTLPLELELMSEIKTRLEKKLGKKVQLFVGLDPNLLGGVQIFMDNVVVDGSVKKHIEDLRTQLKTMSVVQNGNTI